MRELIATFSFAFLLGGFVGFLVFAQPCDPCPGLGWMPSDSSPMFAIFEGDTMIAVSRDKPFRLDTAFVEIIVRRAGYFEPTDDMPDREVLLWAMVGGHFTNIPPPAPDTSRAYIMPNFGHSPPVLNLFPYAIGTAINSLETETRHLARHDENETLPRMQKETPRDR